MFIDKDTHTSEKSKTETNSESSQLLRHCRDRMESSLLSLAAAEGQRHMMHYVNPAFCRLVGKSEKELIGRSFSEAIPEGKENGCVALIERVYHTGEAEILPDQLHLHSQSYPLYWSYSAWPILSTDGYIAGVMIQVTDTTETALFRRQMTTINQELLLSTVRQHEMTETVERQNAQLQAMVTTDGLTGLKNHRAFQERLREEVERASRYHTPLSALFLDLDAFKSYNDTFGHPAGDAVLRKIGEVLQATARTNDLVARYGGEEFAIILTETDAESASLAAERFRSAIEAVRWQERRITASLGVATLSQTAPDPAALIEEADKALYRSKNRGRNCITHFADAAHVTEINVNKSTPSIPMTLQSVCEQVPLLGTPFEAVMENLQHSSDTMVDCWSQLMSMRDQETQGHSVRVMKLMVMLAQVVGMNEEEALLARRGALLHDIGKVTVSDAILHKPGPLTDKEWEVMQLHPVVAFEMLSHIPFLEGPALDIPHYHHERWDGSGYPNGLKGEDIPLPARLFAVIDVYDALLSDRPYRKAWSEPEARQHLHAGMGSHFDPCAVEAFEKMLSQQDRQLTDEA